MKVFLGLLAILISATLFAASNSEVTVVPIPVLHDNYAYVVRWGNKALVVDPGEARPVYNYLKREGLQLHYILNTHHHNDHIDGNQALKKWTGAQIVGPHDKRIPGLDQPVGESSRLNFDGLKVRVLATPGHTYSHIAFYFPNQKLLFTGDALFGAGCGRLFEGTPEDMIGTFDKLKGLPDDTLVYFGHEYTQRNVHSALAMEPNNVAIQERAAKVETQRQANEPTTPSTLGEEKATNPFLRLHDPALLKAIGVAPDAHPVTVFQRVIQVKAQQRR